ncbi:MAG: S8 family serine peptidase [Gemmataceae bacterium]|nr:S8 family serine peptidase [Gemmataceae bacterium]MCI0739237.1 S8 family serine peptidase [Gemmataceae bacterium]
MDDSSAGYLGVNARSLTSHSGVVLTGNNISIGQVENGRPHDPQHDTFSHPDVDPAWVFVRESAAGSSSRDSHATGVAGVMIANGTRNKGIAPNASLYSSASGSAATLAGLQENNLLAAQHVTWQDNSKVRALNHSYGIIELSADGLSHISRGLDWLAKRRNVVNVIALGNAPSDWGPPSDSYNSMVVGATRPVNTNSENVFRQFAPGNANPVPRDAANDRSLVSLVAPGAVLSVPIVRVDRTTDYGFTGGTSYAAPHVAGAIALLQEYAARQNASGAVGWDFEPYIQSALVMKAVLMNSADKVKDIWNGLGLDMEKTILKLDGSTSWLNSPAYQSEEIPLDDELGAGQLNVRRALNQFSSGWVNYLNADGSPKSVPAVGWSQGTLLEGEEFAKFVLDRPLKANSFISITLTWNRGVALDDNLSWWWNHVLSGRIGLYDAGDYFAEDFIATPPKNLDLYLLPKGAQNINQAVWSSRSTQYNVEHIFHTIQQAGEYEFWVRKTDGQNFAENFAVAWWTVAEDLNATGGVGDKVWEDLDRDGMQDPNEPGVAGVHVYLYDADGKYMGKTVSNANGIYQFQFLPQFNYYMVFVPPTGMRFTLKNVGNSQSDSNADSNGYVGGIIVLNGLSRTDLDVGLIRAGVAAGRAWLENEADGVRLASEPAAAELPVTLFTETGDWVDVTLTDSEGNYEFHSLDPGSYYVNFGRVPGRQYTLKDQTTDDVDSDVELSTGNSHVFTVDYYGNVVNIDAGYAYYPVNNSPQGTDKTIELCEDEPFFLTEFDFGFSDPNDLPPHNFKAIIVESLPMAGSLTLNGNPVAVHDIIDVADLEDGNLLYTPPANQYGEALASWQFAVQDDGGNFAEGGGDVDLTPNTITFDVHSTPDAPIGADGVLTLAAGSTYTFTVGDLGFSDPNDVPPDNLYSVIVAALPTFGTLSLNGIPVDLGAEIYAWQIATGSFQYTAASNQYGTPLTSFDFGLRDDGSSEWCEGEVYSPRAYTVLIHVPQNPEIPALSINDVSQVEGNNGTSYFGFRVSLTAPPLQTVTLNYSTAGNTATAFADYAPVTGMLSFIPGGPQTQSIYVPVYGDLQPEADETFFVNLSNVINAIVLDNQGLGTILDDDGFPPPPPPQPEQPSVSINDIIQVEGNSGTTNFVFTVALSGPTTQAVTMNYATANGTATAGADYGAVGGPITFAPGGPLTQTISVLVYGDLACEADETFFVNLANVVNATVADGQGRGTIEDDDTLWATSVIGYSSQWSAGSWSAAQALGKPNTFAYGDISTAWAPYPFNGTLEYITLGFARAVNATGVMIRETYGNGFVYQLDLRDTSGDWHTVWTGTDPSQPGSPVDFFIPVSTTSYLVDAVKIYTDTNHNLNAWEEIDAVRLHDEHCPAPPPPPPPPPPGMPNVSINDVSQVEGDSGTTNFVFTVSLSGPTSQAVTINYATANGTATAGEDYGSTSGPLTFSPGGPLTQTISVPVYGDTDCEPDQTFFVNLSDVTNAAVTDGQGLSTIVDDDVLWANSVIDFSSQWSPGSWSAAQALGKPNTFAYGDIVTAWAPLPINGTLEYITLGFAEAVYATGVTIRETYGNGFVYRVDLRDSSGGWHTIWTGTDPSQPGAPVDFAIPFATTNYLVNAVKIFTDTNHDLNAWEEIDAVRLHDEHCPPGGGGGAGGATIQGTAWNDFDGNGIQNSGESTFAGLIVELRNSIGQLVATTTTDSAGNYQFNNVAPGTYYLVFQKPFGYNFTLQDQGDDNFDSDVNFDGLTAYFSLFENDTKDFDAGLIFGFA